MRAFSINRIPRIVLEQGIAADTGSKVTSLAGKGRNVLLVADPALRELGITDIVSTSLIEAGHDVLAFEEIKSDPTESQIQTAVTLARAQNRNAVVCLGGGSAMDAGKLIGSLINGRSAVIDHRLVAKPLPRSRPPIVCLPTTAGTGSEATSVSVVSNDEGNKYWYWGPELKSDLVLLDPELTVGLPSSITAASGVDAVVHAMEAETNQGRQVPNQTYTLEAIRLGSSHLRQSVAVPNDLTARSGMLLAATYGGISIDNAGTGIAHNIAHAIGSLVPIHHGRAVAIAMAATLQWNIDGDIDRYRAVASAFGSEGPDRLASDFEQFIHDLGIRTNLAEEFPALTAEDVAGKMAAPENKAMRRANARVMGEEDLLPLARMALVFT
ncbi:MAG: iron-containing alcohol dehydrogenase [Stappiaceae bacterium]